MTDEEKENAIRRYLAAYNGFDIEGMVDLLHDQVLFENVAGGEVTARAEGAEAFRQLAHRSKALFSARRQQATRFDFAGDQVTVDIAFEAVLAADLPNGLKAGDVLRLNGRSAFEFKDGRISGITDMT